MRRLSVTGDSAGNWPVLTLEIIHGRASRTGGHVSARAQKDSNQWCMTAIRPNSVSAPSSATICRSATNHSGPLPHPAPPPPLSSSIRPSAPIPPGKRYHSLLAQAYIDGWRSASPFALSSIGNLPHRHARLMTREIPWGISALRLAPSTHGEPPGAIQVSPGTSKDCRSPTTLASSSIAPSTKRPSGRN